MFNLMKNEFIDLSYIGKDTFNFNISQLKNDKKLLKLYFQNIQLFMNAIEDHNKLLKKIIMEIDKYSPMDHIFNYMKKFEIIIKLHFSYLNNFLEKSRNIIEHLKTSIDSNISIISQFLTDIQETSENIKLKSDFFNKQNQFILTSFSQLENSVIEDYYKIDKKNNLNTEQLINDCHKYENDFSVLSNGINSMINGYKDKYNLNMQKIKTNMIELSEKAKTDIINIIEIFKNEFNNISISSNEEIQNLQNFDINNKELEPKLSKYLNYHIEEDELKDLLHPTKYKINLIDMVNKGNHKIKGTNIQPTKQDLYNIVELFYSYDFNMIDKTQYDMNIEKNKIEIIKKTEKLLGMDLIKNIKTDIEIFPEDEINNFIEFLFSKEDYLLEFLLCLNFFRTLGNLEFSEEQFNIIKIVFCRASDYLSEHKNKNLYYHLIILSQTYYKLNNGKKYFLQEEIKNKEFFLNNEFWIEFIEEMINKELIKFENQMQNSTKSEEEKSKRKEEVISAYILSLFPSFNNFNLKKESIDSILLAIVDKYNLNEEKREYLFKLFADLKK
jgi:hypothetical protein